MPIRTAYICGFKVTRDVSDEQMAHYRSETRRLAAFRQPVELSLPGWGTIRLVLDAYDAIVGIAYPYPPNVIEFFHREMERILADAEE